MFDGTPPLFFICCSISKRFYRKWKAVDFLDNIRFILWVVALREACDVCKHGCHLGYHLGFHQELEIRLKRQELVIVCSFNVKQLLSFKKLKNMDLEYNKVALRQW